MNSITERIPSIATIGLATFSIFAQPYTGEVTISPELSIVTKWDVDNNLRKSYLVERFGLSNVTNIMSFGSEVVALVNSIPGFSDFLDNTILKLQSSFDVFGYALEVYVDPVEAYESLRLNIFSMDDDKIEKYSNFIDSWVETVPEEFQDKILFSV
jgi:hypothetical protein